VLTVYALWIESVECVITCSPTLPSFQFSQALVETPKRALVWSLFALKVMLASMSLKLVLFTHSIHLDKSSPKQPSPSSHEARNCARRKRLDRMARKI
jgi:hypothetical protein